MKQLESYTYTVPAGGSVQIPAPNDNFYVTASNGPLSVRGDTFGRLRGIVAGQGLKGVPFNRLELIDESGAPNTVTILLTPAEFVNQVFSGSVAIVGALALQQSTVNSLIRPEASTGNWNSAATMVANTPLTVFTPPANVNGAILLTAEAHDQNAALINQCFIAKSSPPANVGDGEIMLQTRISAATGTAVICSGQLQKPQRIAPGLGLYFISNLAGTANYMRNARFILL